MTSVERVGTSRDLARLAGVSQSTVSRVLTNHPRVSAETRAKVLKVLAETNYTPHALARAMKTGRTDTIGVFMSRVTSPFHAKLLDVIARRLRSLGLRMTALGRRARRHRGVQPVHPAAARGRPGADVRHLRHLAAHGGGGFGTSHGPAASRHRRPRL